MHKNFGSNIKYIHIYFTCLHIVHFMFIVCKLRDTILHKCIVFRVFHVDFPQRFGGFLLILLFFFFKFLSVLVLFVSCFFCSFVSINHMHVLSICIFFFFCLSFAALKFIKIVNCTFHKLEHAH